MLPFHIRLERLKLIFYGFILNFFINITLKLLQFAFFFYLHMYLPLRNLIAIILVYYFEK